MEPSFSLSADRGQQFLKAMADIAAKRGIKTDADMSLQGKVAAIEAHLSDMRKLVYKQSGIR
jgi:hypothetical protein